MSLIEPIAAERESPNKTVPRICQIEKTMLPFPHPFFNLSFARCFSFVLALTGKRKTSFLQAPRFPLSLNGVLFFSRQSPLRLRFHPLRLPRVSSYFSVLTDPFLCTSNHAWLLFSVVAVIYCF